VTVAAQIRHPEQAMMEPLLDWLLNHGWIRHDTMLAPELPWHGRRVDLAALTRTGISSAFELKLAHTRRVLEQSSLNGLSFDRSCIVTATRPSQPNLGQAAQLGLGVILVRPDSGLVELLLRPTTQKVEAAVRLRLRRKIHSIAGDLDVR